MKKMFWHSLFSLLFLSTVSSAALADLYKYTDDTGTVCLTNNLQSVPKKYRSAMTVTKDDSQGKQTLLPEVKSVDKDSLPHAAPQVLAKESTLVVIDKRSSYIRSGLIVAGIIASYFVLTRLMGALGLHKVGMILFMAVALTGCVYLYNLYIKQVSDVFSVLRKDAQNIQKNVESREVKTEQLLKKLPEAE